MVATPPSSLTDFPAEMVAAVELEAARQAQWLAQFLDALGPETIPKNRMTPRFLLHLGAALRLRTWEAQGFYFHRAADLPDADQALRDAMRSLRESTADPTEFCMRLLRLSIERFAWNGPRDLNADVALDDGSEDAALDALAEYLWATRHAEAVADRPQP